MCIASTEGGLGREQPGALLPVFRLVSGLWPPGTVCVAQRKTPGSVHDVRERVMNEF